MLQERRPRELRLTFQLLMVGAVLVGLAAFTTPSMAQVGGAGGAQVGGAGGAQVGGAGGSQVGGAGGSVGGAGGAQVGGAGGGKVERRGGGLEGDAGWEVGPSQKAKAGSLITKEDLSTLAERIALRKAASRAKVN